MDLKNVPNEVLLHVFEQLDWKSLQNIADASERFNQLIFSSTKLQSKLFLDVYANNIRDAASKSEKLPYRNISISTKTTYGQHFEDFIQESNEIGCTEQFNEFIVKILIDHKNHIEKLKIVKLNGFFLRKFFPLFENLKELQLLDICDYYPNSVLIDLPNLKFLEFNASSEILQNLTAVNLEEIVIHGLLSWNERFLERVKNLKKLTFYGLSLPGLDSSVIWNLKLKKLQFNFMEQFSSFVDVAYQSVNNKFSYTKTENFLVLQKDSLEELSIEFKSTQIKSEKIIAIIQFCVSELQKLTKFSIKINQNYLNFTKFDKISINNSVKNLEIHGHLDTLNLLSLISSCPSVTNLIINNHRPTKTDVLHFISTHMQNLKNLTIKSFFNEISQNTNFENVKKLNITKLFSNSREVWHKIALACPNCKELTLNDEIIEIFPQELEKVLKKCQKLEIINFNADWKFHFFQGFFEAFVNYPGKLKRINFSCKYFDEFDYERIRFLVHRTNIQINLKQLSNY